MYRRARLQAEGCRAREELGLKGLSCNRTKDFLGFRVCRAQGLNSVRLGLTMGYHGLLYRYMSLASAVWRLRLFKLTWAHVKMLGAAMRFDAPPETPPLPREGANTPRTKTPPPERDKSPKASSRSTPSR